MKKLFIGLFIVALFISIGAVVNFQADNLYTPARTMKLHRDYIQTGSVASTWTNCTGFKVFSDETSGDVATLLSDSIGVIVNYTGMYMFEGCLHVQNNTVGIFSDITVLSRLTENSVEMRCSQRGYTVSMKASGEDVISYIATASLTKGDTIRLQYWTDNTGVDFYSNAAFTNPIAYTLIVNYMGYKQ